MPDAPSDTEPEPDSAPEPDTTVAPDVGPTDPYAPGPLVYDKIGNVLITDDLRRVRWDRSGAFALIFGSGPKVLRYDAATNALSLAGTLGTSLADVDVANEGGWFLIVGKDGSQSTLWRVSLDEAGQLVIDDTIAIPTGTGSIITIEPGSNPSRFAIGATGSSMYIGHIYLFDLKNGLSAPKGLNTSAGLWDLMWGDPLIQAGFAHLVTSEGLNGGGSHSWIVGSPDVVGNGWGGGFGNGGTASWRPDGGYGVVCGWSSNKLYVYDGSWTMGTLPVPTGAAPQAVDWRDHGRGLVVGRIIGNPPYAVAVELRGGATEDWADTSLVDQSIKGFDKAPWFGNTSSMHLLDVDWRPGVACDEGLIVGSDNGGQFDPSYGLVIRFHDGDDPACTP